MALIFKEKADITYASVLADGLIHMNVPEGTEGAVTREYETSTGEKGSKTEVVFTEIVGLITNVEFREGNYGMQLVLTIADGEDKPVALTFGTSSNYAEDLMKKLPNIDMSKYVKIAPYSFDNDKGKKQRGVTVLQDNDKKITDFFTDPETKEKINGFPATPKPKKGGKKLSTEEWKIYFAQARVFLIDYLTDYFDKSDKGELAKEFDS